jgi:cation transport regulator ChaC
MKDTLRDQQTYMKSACVVAVSEIGGELALLKVRDRNYVPRIKVVREMVAGTEIAHVFDTWTGWSEGVNEHGIGVVSSALLVEVDEGQKKVPTGDSGTGRKIREILGARTMDAAIEIIMGNLVKGCTFISDGKRTVLVEYDGNPKKGGTEPELHTLKSGITMARTNHGVFLEGAGYTEEYQDGSDLKSSEVRKETAEKALDAAKDVEDVAAALARSRKKDRSDPFNAVRATDNMTTSSQIVTVPAERRMLVYLVPEEVDFVGIDNELPKGRKPKVKIQVFGFKDWDSEDPKPVELKGDLEVFRLFTYGSMMGRPSHTKDVIRSYKATLSGYHRAYNRSSQSRDGISVIGTEPGGKLEGLIHEYPVSMGHRVLGQVDRREGFRTERPEDKNSYIRHPINVKTPDGIARAIVYLSNPDGPNYNKPLTPVQAAKEVLAHPKAQKYLRGLVTAVEEHGIKAPYIKKVNDRVSKGSAVKKASRIATTIDEILQNTGPSVMRRVQGVSASGHRFNPKKGIWTFRVLGSQGKTYTVRVKGIRKGNVARLEKAQVRVSCSCPYFRWQGPEHWAKKHGYLYGKQVGTASDPAIKDPKGKHWACKHAVAALRMARNYRFGSGEDGWSLDGPLVAMADPVCVAVRYKQAKPEKALYTAVFLDDPTALKRWWVEETGIPLLSKHYGHHMTIKFKPDAQEVVDLPIGKRASIRIVGWAGDAKGQAVKVESSVRSTKKIAHITVATDGTSPVYSNKLLAKGVTAANGRLGGRVGYQSTKGREVFDLKGTIYELLSKKGPRTAMLPEQVTDERDHGVRRDEPEDGDGSKLPGDAEEGDG